jgi:hypothetical protein
VFLTIIPTACFLHPIYNLDMAKIWVFIRRKYVELTGLNFCNSNLQKLWCQFYKLSFREQNITDQ